MIRGQQWYKVAASRGQKVSTFLVALFFAPGLALGAEDTSGIASSKATITPTIESYYGWQKPTFSANFIGNNYSEGKNEENLVRLDLNAETSYQLSSWSHFQLSPRLTLMNGRVQNRFDAEASQTSRIGLRDTYLSLHTKMDEWLENLELRLGAHWQRFLHAPLLVSGRRSFIGAQERTTVKLAEEWKLRFVAQQAIPDSSSDNGIREDREKTPIFSTETLALQWKKKDVIQVEPFVTHYRYSNLPAVVAADSAVMGNQILGEVGPDSRFRYGFNGIMAGVDLSINVVEKLKFEIYAYQIQNNSAPAGTRRAQWLEFGLPYEVSDNLYVRPSYAKYFIESEVVPAAYSSGTTGHNNRDGQHAGIDIGFKNLGFEIETRYIEAKTINPTPEQNKLYTFYIGIAIGTQYDVQ